MTEDAVTVTLNEVFDQMLSPTDMTIGFDYRDSQSIGPGCHNEQARRARQKQWKAKTDQRGDGAEMGVNQHVSTTS